MSAAAGAGARLRIAFLHPDLGLGGAERLIVDAAHGLAKKGHAVTVYTSHYERERSFAETRDGSFDVRVAGDWMPRHIFGGLYIIFAILRNIWLALSIALWGSEMYDVFICDQVSASVPILRLLRPRARVLFYCHFPDQLLSPRKSLLKSLYRWPFDLFEELTTGCAHRIVVNSGFTRATFKSTFKRLQDVQPAILYPCIQVDRTTKYTAPNASPAVLLSINRYERKKAIDIAITAFAKVVRSAASSSSSSSTGASGAASATGTFSLPTTGGSAAVTATAATKTAGGAAPHIHLVIAGGYDVRMPENTEHYRELVAVATREGLMGDAVTHDCSDVLPGFPPHDRTAAQLGYEQVERGAHVTFIRSFTDAQKSYLLRACSAVVYTPSHEHFGIVPLEAMAAFRPVIAVNNGGPLESVKNGQTGFLCEPTADAFATAMGAIAADPSAVRTMGEAGNRHVIDHFSREAFSDSLNAMCLELASGGAPSVSAAGAAASASAAAVTDEAPAARAHAKSTQPAAAPAPAAPQPVAHPMPVVEQAPRARRLLD